MARRATSLNKGRTSREPKSADRAEDVATKPPRRGTKTKPRDVPPADTSVTDAFLPGGEDRLADAAGSGASEPAKARRGRKPRSIELAAETLTSDDGGADETTALAPEVQAAEENDRSDIVEAPAATTSTSLASADSKASASAARWDADTGTASFDWPIIEAVAASAGPNQAMAKLLLAARAEGANSRWPF